jgi:hypothetical protein
VVFRTRPHYWPRSIPILPERGLRFAPPQSQLSGTPVNLPPRTNLVSAYTGFVVII